MLPGTGTSNIDFMTLDVLQLLLSAKINFSQGGYDRSSKISMCLLATTNLKVFMKPQN